MSLYKKYLDTTIENKKVKFTIYFNRGRSFATNQPLPIGYRVSATPVEIGDKFETFTAFSGFTDSLLECNRQSSKRLDEAIKILDNNMEKYIEWFKDKGICFKENKNE